MMTFLQKYTAGTFPGKFIYVKWETNHSRFISDASETHNAKWTSLGLRNIVIPMCVASYTILMNGPIYTGDG